jgi:endoglucanase
MKILFPVIACLVAVSVSAAAQTTLSRISVQENNFVSEDGKVVVFRGLNTSDPDKLESSGHWNERYFKEMKSWGANIVRFPVHPTAWRKRGKEEYLRLLDQGVAFAEAQGMYVIIDWHSIGNLKNEMYQHPMYETTRKETFEFWRTMANHFKANTTVAFFELFNEPTVIRGELGSCTWGEWKALMEEIILIIRATGCKAVPLVAGFNWAYDLKEVEKNPINAPGIGYVSHPYPQKRNKPWEKQWTDDWGFIAKKYPLILTEIGFCGPDDKGAHVPVISDESYGEAITKYTRERGISWVVWVFDPQWSPMLFSDWDFTPTRQGKYFKEALKAD